MVGPYRSARRPENAQEKRLPIPLETGILGKMTASRPAAPRRHLPTSPFAPPAEEPPVERYAVNDRVSHDQYGLGVVIGVEGDTAVLVDFRPQRVRITAPFRKMTKL